MNKNKSLDFHIFLEESNLRFWLRSAERQRKRANVVSSSYFVRGNAVAIFIQAFNPQEDDYFWERGYAELHTNILFFLWGKIQLLFSILKIAYRKFSYKNIFTISEDIYERKEKQFVYWSFRGKASYRWEKVEEIHKNSNPDWNGHQKGSWCDRTKWYTAERKKYLFSMFRFDTHPPRSARRPSNVISVWVRQAG